MSAEERCDEARCVKMSRAALAFGVLFGAMLVAFIAVVTTWAVLATQDQKSHWSECPRDQHLDGQALLLSQNPGQLEFNPSCLRVAKGAPPVDMYVWAFRVNPYVGLVRSLSRTGVNLYVEPVSAADPTSLHARELVLALSVTPAEDIRLFSYSAEHGLLGIACRREGLKGFVPCVIQFAPDLRSVLRVENLRFDPDVMGRVCKNWVIFSSPKHGLCVHTDSFPLFRVFECVRDGASFSIGKAVVAHDALAFFGQAYPNIRGTSDWVPVNLSPDQQLAGTVPAENPGFLVLLHVANRAKKIYRHLFLLLDDDLQLVAKTELLCLCRGKCSKIQFATSLQARGDHFLASFGDCDTSSLTNRFHWKKLQALLH